MRKKILRIPVSVVVAGAILGLLSVVGLLSDVHLPLRLGNYQDASGSIGLVGLFHAMRSTMMSYCIGLLAATLVGTTLGVLLGCSQFAQRAIFPIVELLRPMPSVAIIPVAVLAFGLGLRMRFVVVAYGAVWPLLLGSYYGIRHVDRELLDIAVTFRLGPSATLLKVIAPAALPNIATGLRTASGIALLLAVSIELIAGGEGIGSFISDAEYAHNYSAVYLALLVTGCLGYLINELLLWIETRLSRWRNGQPN